MSFDPVSYAMGAKAGGGSNPNRVQTIPGTFEDPFGDGELDFNELLSGLGANGMTLILSAMGKSMMGQPGPGGGILFGTVIFDAPTDAAPWIGGSVCYGSTARMVYAKVLQGSVWADLPATTPTVLTLIRHPLPEEG